MAFTTQIQQVLAFLKAGHPLQPPVGTAIPTLQGPTTAPVVPAVKPTTPAPISKGGM